MFCQNIREIQNSSLECRHNSLNRRKMWFFMLRRIMKSLLKWWNNITKVMGRSGRASRKKEIMSEVWSRRSIVLDLQMQKRRKELMKFWREIFINRISQKRKLWKKQLKIFVLWQLKSWQKEEIEDSSGLIKRNRLRILCSDSNRKKTQNEMQGNVLRAPRMRKNWLRIQT